MSGVLLMYVLWCVTAGVFCYVVKVYLLCKVFL
jgi:hypothetical protein